MKKLGYTLMMLRHSRKMSRAQVSAKSGLSERTIRRLESGETGTVQNLAAYLGVFDIQLIDILVNNVPSIM